MAASGLISLLSRLHAVMECEFSLSGASFSVLRTTGDYQGVLIANLFRSVRTVPIMLDFPNQIRDVEKLKNANSTGLYYFRESTRASTVKTQLGMLAIAAEAFAGRLEVTVNCGCGLPLRCSVEKHKPLKRMQSDPHKLKLIWGDQLYATLYKQPDELRNKLMHGGDINEGQALEVATEGYRRIRDYLAEAHGLENSNKISKGPRTNYSHSVDVVCLRPFATWSLLSQDTEPIKLRNAFRELEQVDLANRELHMDTPDRL